MSRLSIQLPNSLHKQLRECADAEGASVDQLVSSAVAEKLAALLDPNYLDTRAKRGSRKKFEAVLESVPDVEPQKHDQLPDGAIPRDSVRPKRRKSTSSNRDS